MSGAEIIGAIVYAIVATALSFAVQALLASSNDSSLYRRGNMLDNTKISSSSNGAFITEVLGSARVPGNIIFAKELEKRTHVKTQTVSSGGGKGGGGGGGSTTVTTETYTYHATFAIALCRGPIVGVKKIWVGNEIKYNVDISADYPTVSASKRFEDANFTIYTGDPNQPIDPVLQDALGAEATAYRDVAYIVFHGWDVTKYGGIPPLGFEVVQKGTVVGDQIQSDVVYCKEIIDYISEKAGVIDFVDTTAVTGEVMGVIINSVGQFRDVLDSLMDSKFISAIESEGKIKFFNRNKNIIETISSDDFVVYKGNKPYKIRITDESSLPSEVSINYIDYNQNYQPSSQFVRNEYGNINNKFSITFPIAMNATEARGIADIFKNLIWSMRTEYEFMLPIRYIYLEPGDIINVNFEDEGEIVPLYISKIILGNNGVMKVFASEYDEEAFQTSEQATESNISLNDFIYNAGDSVVYFDNMHGVNNTTMMPGYFSSISGTTKYWNFASVYRSIDGGISFDPYYISSPAVTGKVLTTINDGNKYRIDNESYIDVELNIGFELESFNLSAILNGKNAGIFGDEIILFQNAQLMGGSVYRLSKLVRGRNETHEFMNSHVANERFVLLPSSDFIAVNNSEIGKRYYYKVLSEGQTLADVAPFQFTINGDSVRPLSPCWVEGSRDANGTITITWLRRDRGFFAWADSIVAPMSEDKEKYIVEIYDSNDNLVREIETTTEQAVYTDAEQINDFGSVQPAVKTSIYQIGSIVRVGDKITQTI